MARTQLAQPPAEITTVNLVRLLARLEQKLPPVTPQSLAPTGPLPNAIERRKIAANLEYARQLLLQLETEYATMKMSAQRKKVQEELRGKKVEIRRLNERLHGVEQLEATLEEEEEKAEGLHQNEKETEAEKRKSSDISEEDGGRKSQDHTTTSALRNRFSSTPVPTSTTTALATSHKSNATTSTTTAVATSTKPSSPQELEQSLTAHSRQQEALTSDLLQMSRLLKESSLQFGKHLEDEKPYLEQAAAGLDKNILGMQGAGGRLEKLRKDGTVGWYKTLINMAIIIILGIVGLIILMLPKLRR